jgi:hypothetical protein
MSRHLTEHEFCRAIAGLSTLDEQHHLRQCAACRGELAHSRQLFAAFRHDVRTRAERTTPPPLAASGLADTRSRTTGPRTIQPLWTMAAMLLIAASGLLWQVRQSPPSQAQQDPAPRAIGADGGSEFFPLTYSSVPVTHGRIVRIEVPRSAPALFGVDPAGLVTMRNGAVVADVVVGEDGLARAVRFVRPAVDAINKE